MAVRPGVEGDAGARASLLEQRRQLQLQVARLSADLAAVVHASEDSNADDEHDPEGATIAFERQQLASLLQRARDRLDDVDQALAGVDDGSYGRCRSCGGPIGAERLEARPSAVSCISCAHASR